jgi:hypothetical protein
MGGGSGVSLGAAADYPDTAIYVRFQTDNVIDAINGPGHTAENVISYTPGVSYHFRVVVDVPSRTYSAYVTPQGGGEIAVATNYAFRSDQAAASSLSHFNTVSRIGTQQVCNFRIVPPSFKEVITGWITNLLDQNGDEKVNSLDFTWILP